MNSVVSNLENAQLQAKCYFTQKRRTLEAVKIY